jgi:two-component system, sporulation sensor kinase E
MGAMAVFQDISDNQQKPGNNRKYGKLLEKEIRQSYDDVLASEEKFFKVFENLKWGVALLDNEGRILTSNMSLQEMLGYQKEALAGLHFHDLFIFSEREDDEKMKDLFHTLSTDKINHYQVEKCYALQNGQRRWFEVTVSHTKVFGDNGSHPWIAMAVINDITERLTLQQRLIKIDKLNIIDRLGLSLAHEINNPLQSALGSLGIAEEILEKDNEAHRFLIIAIEELERVVEIVRYLRDLGSKPEMEKRVSIDVNTLVNKTLTLTEKHALNSQVEIDWQPVENLPLVPEVSGLLIQVFTNLVINAIQAMPDGGRLKIRTVPTDEPCGVNITFADTGVGIAPETLSRLFEPFHSTQPIGFGLGLYICQKNIEDLGGRIEVESQVGAGTTFTVWLPC